MLNLVPLFMHTNTTRTVADWLRGPSNPFTPVLLAKRIDSSAARALCRAADELHRADPDNEAAWNNAADAYDVAEADFLAIHANTEVTL